MEAIKFPLQWLYGALNSTSLKNLHKMRERPISSQQEQFGNVKITAVKNIIVLTCKLPFKSVALFFPS